MIDKYAKRQRREQEMLQRQVAYQERERAEHKARRRLEKLHNKQRKAKEEPTPLPAPLMGPLHVACLIHGQVYDWQYVDKLYNSVTRNTDHEVVFHVFTEAHREVPSYMIKHSLDEWAGVSGPRKGWWYKMQIFNPLHHAGPLLYLDLDTVIVGNIDWIPKLSIRYFWASRDFRSLWRPYHRGINSSVMWWDTQRHHWIWDEFIKRDINHLVKQYAGDQDYVTDLLTDRDLRYFLPQKAVSWRWQCLDGGLDFRTRKYREPNSGTKFDPEASLLIFHGSPKPHEVQHDQVVHNFWR
jgi:hypothetical protein